MCSSSSQFLEADKSIPFHLQKLLSDQCREWMKHNKTINLRYARFYAILSDMSFLDYTLLLKELNGDGSVDGTRTVPPQVHIWCVSSFWLPLLSQGSQWRWLTGFFLEESRHLPIGGLSSWLIFSHKGKKVFILWSLPRNSTSFHCTFQDLPIPFPQDLPKGLPILSCSHWEWKPESCSLCTDFQIQ